MAATGIGYVWLYNAILLAENNEVTMKTREGSSADNFDGINIIFTQTK